MHAEQPRSWISNNYTSFNGLRGLAILLVFVNHYGHLVLPYKSVRPLWVGVDLFFVLSGFLITGILYDSREGPSYFKSFYLRRTLRIFPLYYGFFALVGLGILTLHWTVQPAFWSNLLYLQNFNRFHPMTNNPTLISIPHGNPPLLLGTLWSLCVEEQFYLVWPMILWLLPNRQAMMRVAALAAIACLILRTSLYFSNPAAAAELHYLYILTPTRCDGLFIGSWLALWLRGTKLRRSELHRIAYSLLIPSVVVLVVGAATVGQRWKFDEMNPLLCTYGYTLVDLAAAGVLLIALDEQSRLSRVMRNRALAGMGVVSYGFYFLHGIPLDYWNRFARLHEETRHIGEVTVTLAFVTTLTLAWLSYRFFESPFLRLKDKLAPSHRSIPSGKEQPLPVLS